jgi:GAF domain-containing protein
LLLRDGETFRALTTRGYPESLTDILRQGGQPGPSHPIRQLVDGESFAHVPDLAIIEEPWAQSVAQLAGVRTSLWVPLRRDGNLLGSITAARPDVRPFTDKQIALLQNFAAQAVIAMENARLLTETREALEQQTATAEVLQVINSSPGDLAPVFDAILEKGMRLCEAAQGALVTYDGEYFRAVATLGQTPAFANRLRQPFRPAAGGPQQRLLTGERLVHVPDVTVFAEADPVGRTAAEAGIRSLLMVPLRKDDALLGYIAANRLEVRLFTDKQIVLLQNFAAQAVIAMENARLLTETREALEQQTATAEVLQVINSSPGDLAPVFDAMLRKAARLCEAAFGTLWIRDGDVFRLAAHHGVPADLEKALLSLGPIEPREGSALRRLLDGEDVLQFRDLAAEALPDRTGGRRAALIQLGGARAALWVALRKEDGVVGVVHLYRREVRPFSDREIEFRGAGGYRNGKCAVVDRDARSFGAADCHRRGVTGHQFLAGRPHARVRCDIGEGAHLMRRSSWKPAALRRRELARRRDTRRVGGIR